MKKSYGKQYVSDDHWYRWYSGYWDNTSAWKPSGQDFIPGLDDWEIDENGEPIDLMRAYGLEDDDE